MLGSPKHSRQTKIEALGLQLSLSKKAVIILFLKYVNCILRKVLSLFLH